MNSWTQPEKSSLGEYLMKIGALNAKNHSIFVYSWLHIYRGGGGSRRGSKFILRFYHRPPREMNINRPCTGSKICNCSESYVGDDGGRRLRG